MVQSCRWSLPKRMGKLLTMPISRPRCRPPVCPYTGPMKVNWKSQDSKRIVIWSMWSPISIEAATSRWPPVLLFPYTTTSISSKVESSGIRRGSFSGIKDRCRVFYECHVWSINVEISKGFENRCVCGFSDAPLFTPDGGGDGKPQRKPDKRYYGRYRRLDFAFLAHHHVHNAVAEAHRLERS